MKKLQKKSRIITGVLLAVFGVGTILAIFGLSRAVVSVDEIAVSKEPEAILASAGVNDGTTVSLPVAYFDQRSDACVNMYDAGANEKIAKRQFEWTECGYNNKKLEQGIVEYELNQDYLPVARGGEALSNRGVKDMKRWFSAVEGKSKAYSADLDLIYKANGATEFSFGSDAFYPLDEVDFSKGDKVNKDGHNHLFTMSLAVPFTVMANNEENFEITADDDTFVFVGTKLAIDMGGIHETTTGKLTINEAGEVYSAVADEDLAYSGIQVAKEEGSIVRVFHADRDSDESVLKMKITGMNLNVVSTQLANGDGVQVAYDPADPSYVGPLGETKVFSPDGTRGYIIMATIMGALVVVLSVFTVLLAHSLAKNRAQK